MVSHYGLFHGRRFRSYRFLLDYEFCLDDVVGRSIRDVRNYHGLAAENETKRE